MNPNPILFVPYRAEYALETVKMWRQAFQRALGMEEHNRYAQLEGHLEFLASHDPANLTVAIDPGTSAIVGFLGQAGTEVDHLYVHIDYQGQGIGSTFLRAARERSPDLLELFTFAQNLTAQRFYHAKGFVEVRRGHAKLADNPWATSRDQLADIRYRWQPAAQPAERSD